MSKIMELASQYAQAREHWVDGKDGDDVAQCLKELQAEANRMEAELAEEKRLFTQLCGDHEKLAMEAQLLRGRVAALEGQQGEPVAWWIPKAEQFALANKDGSRPFAKAWEPLFPCAGARKAQPAENAAAKHWHDLYVEVCGQAKDNAARFGAEIIALEAALAAGAREPAQPHKLSESEVWANNAIMAINADTGLSMSRLMEFVRSVESAIAKEKTT